MAARNEVHILNSDVDQHMTATDRRVGGRHGGSGARSLRGVQERMCRLLPKVATEHLHM